MEHLTTTPFGRRPVTAGLMARATANRQVAEFKTMDKWSLFRDLSAARSVYGLNDRALLVLNALLSFHPGATLQDGSGLIVFPSNISLSERAHGMAESTLRRHLATLVEAGLIARHDSPNGKRYARRRSDGEITRAFGFDLRPLLLRAPEIIRAAEEIRAATEALRSTRERITLLKRDALKLASYATTCALPGPWAEMMEGLATLHTRLRRKLAHGDLLEIEAQLVDMLAQIESHLPVETEELSGCDSENGRHYQSSDKDSYESETLKEDETTEILASHPPSALAPRPSQTLNKLSLQIVLQACPDILPYAERRIEGWRDLVNAAGLVRGMMGINPSAWEEARAVMGPETAAIAVACILQRFAKIRNPGGYLRSLSLKTREGHFSPAPMVMALLSPQAINAA
ncbi:plasmid replication protein RepC [Arenibacterium sp. LLYu02]|uniref:plasmid replication protein RepC n=1 Tax=Arenibacterium sp. LLYu02 TaxID=3404132 RepID=UPI003B216550